MDTTSINTRYSSLAVDTCCLSCGGAINHADPVPGEYCVDLGSGRGTDVLRMGEKVGVKGFVYGIDASEGMIETAQKNAAKLEANNVQFIKSDLEKLPLPDNIIDLVISNCTINHASDKTQVWNEIYRILKPGGRFVVSDIYSIEPVPDVYRNDPVAVSECWAGSVTREEYMNTLINSGFKEIKILEESQPYKKGLIHVASFTIFGKRAGKCCCG
jgi:arsenite methyltransferase